MALIPCQECGKQVSDKAAACPHCGAPVTIITTGPAGSHLADDKLHTSAQQPHGCFRPFIFIAAILLLIALIMFGISQLYKPSPPTNVDQISSSKTAVMPIADKIVVSRFELVTKTSGYELQLSLDTDLPDSTEIFLSVNRPYWVLQDGESWEAQVTYYDQEITVKQAAKPVTIFIGDSVFHAAIEKQKAISDKFGGSFKVTKVSDLIVSAIVPINQSPPFSEKNKNLEGVGVVASYIGNNIRKMSHLNRPLGFRDVEAEREAMAEVKMTPFPGLDAARLSRLVVDSMPPSVQSAIADSTHHEKTFPLIASGSVKNDLDEDCAYKQYTLNGVRYFYKTDSDVEPFQVAVMEFRDPGCMKAHLPGSGLSRIATNINKETAISWLQDPKAARTKVEDLKIPKDESAQGLCTPSRGSVSYSYLVQYVIRQGAIAAVIQSYMWPDSC